MFLVEVQPYILVTRRELSDARSATESNTYT